MSKDQPHRFFVSTVPSSFGTLLLILPVKVVCVSPIWRADEDNCNDENYQSWVYRLVINWACEETGANYLNGEDAVPHDMVYYGDSNGLHLNTEGHEVFTEWLVNQMVELGFW